MSSENNVSVQVEALSVGISIPSLAREPDSFPAILLQVQSCFFCLSTSLNFYGYDYSHPVSDRVLFRLTRSHLIAAKAIMSLQYQHHYF